MNRRALETIGLPPPLWPLAKQVVAVARQAGLDQQEIRRRLAALVAAPESFAADPHVGRLAAALVRQRAGGSPGHVPRAAPVPWRQWGSDIDPQAVEQMQQRTQQAEEK